MMQRFVLWMAFFFLLAQAKSQNPVELFQKANNHFEKSEYKECIALLQSIEKQIGANPKIYSLFVRAYLTTPDYIKASIAIHKFKKLVAGKSSQAITAVLSLEPEISAGLEKAQQDHQKNILIIRKKEADAVIAAIEQQKAQQKKALQESFTQAQDEVLNSSELNKSEIDALSYRKILPDSLISLQYQKLRNSKRVLYQFNINFSDSTMRYVTYCNLTENDEEGIYKYSYSVSFDEKNYPPFSEEMLSKNFYSKSNRKALPAEVSSLQGMPDINGKQWRQYVSKSIDGNGTETTKNTRYILFVNKKNIVDSAIEGSDKHVYKLFYNKDQSLLLRETYTSFENNTKDYYISTNYTYSNQYNATYKSRTESLEDDSGWELNSKPNPKWVITESNGSRRFNLLGDITHENYYEKGKLTGSNSYYYVYDQFGRVLDGQTVYKSDNSRSLQSGRSFIHYSDGIKTGYAEYYYIMGYKEMQKKNYDSAITFYQKSLTYKPDYLSALTDLARSYSYSGKNEEAIIYAEKAMEIDPFNSFTYFLLGSIYRDQGEKERGVKLIKTAAEMGSSAAKKWLTENGY